MDPPVHRDLVEALFLDHPGLVRRDLQAPGREEERGWDSLRLEKGQHPGECHAVPVLSLGQGADAYRSVTESLHGLVVHVE